MTTRKQATKTQPRRKKPYSVLLTREATEHAYAIVWASSSRAAEKAAIEKVDPSTLEWEHNEGSEGEPYICTTEGTAEEITEDEAREELRHQVNGSQSPS